jgi:hypothetical protein
VGRVVKMVFLDPENFMIFSFYFLFWVGAYKGYISFYFPANAFIDLYYID